MFEVRLHGEAAFLCALVDDASIIQVCGSVRPRFGDAASEDTGSFREVGESVEGGIKVIGSGVAGFVFIVLFGRCVCRFDFNRQMKSIPHEFDRVLDLITVVHSDK